MEAAALKEMMAAGQMTQGALGAVESVTGGDYQSDRFAFNANMAEIQARDAVARGDEESDRLLRDISGIVGRQRTSLAGQGLDVSTGTAGKIQEQTKTLGELDALTLRANAKRAALGYRAVAVFNVGEAERTRREGWSKGLKSLISGGLQAARTMR